MDVMQLAGHLSLNHNAVVTGPDRMPDHTVTQVILPNGKGIGITQYNKGVRTYPDGPLNVWGIEETGEEHVTSWGIKSPVLPVGREYGVTMERIREVFAAMAALTEEQWTPDPGKNNEGMPSQYFRYEETRGAWRHGREDAERDRTHAAAYGEEFSGEAERVPVSYLGMSAMIDAYRDGYRTYEPDPSGDEQ